MTNSIGDDMGVALEMSFGLFEFTRQGLDDVSGYTGLFCYYECFSHGLISEQVRCTPVALRERRKGLHTVSKFFNYFLVVIIVIRLLFALLIKLGDLLLIGIDLIVILCSQRIIFLYLCLVLTNFLIIFCNGSRVVVG